MGWRELLERLRGAPEEPPSPMDARRAFVEEVGLGSPAPDDGRRVYSDWSEERVLDVLGRPGLAAARSELAPAEGGAAWRWLWGASIQDALLAMRVFCGPPAMARAWLLRACEPSTRAGEIAFERGPAVLGSVSVALLVEGRPIRVLFAHRNVAVELSTPTAVEADLVDLAKRVRIDLNKWLAPAREPAFTCQLSHPRPQVGAGVTVASVGPSGVPALLFAQRPPRERVELLRDGSTELLAVPRVPGPLGLAVRAVDPKTLETALLPLEVEAVPR